MYNRFMTKYNTLKPFIIFSISLLMLWFNWSYSLGWLMGWIILLIIRKARLFFYESIIDVHRKNTGIYILYFVFIFLILWVPPLISFMVPHLINPYTLIVTYFIDRFEMYILRIFFKVDE